MQIKDRRKCTAALTFATDGDTITINGVEYKEGTTPLSINIPVGLSSIEAGGDYVSVKINGVTVFYGYEGGTPVDHCAVYLDGAVEIISSFE